MPRSAILSGTTIVVVEDYADTLFGITQFLTRHGAKVFPSPDAFEGLQAVREHRPHIVLSDIRLPKRDGFELLRDIRALHAENGGNVPVIAMTAFGGFAIRARTIAAGFQAHLDKPFVPKVCWRQSNLFLEADLSFPRRCRNELGLGCAGMPKPRNCE